MIKIPTQTIKSMFRFPFILSAAITVSSFLAPNSTLAQEGSEAQTSAILDAWEKKTKRFPVLRIKWEEEFTMFSPQIVPSFMEQKSESEVPYPNTRATTHTLILGETRVKYHYHRPGSEKNGFETSFDGTVGVGFDATERRDNDEHPRASIRPTKRFGWANMMRLRPVLSFLRPLSSSFYPIRLQEMTRDQDTAIIRGAQCVSFSKETKGINFNKESYFIDPRVDHSIVRFTHTVNGSLRYQFDVEYQRLDNSIFAPKSWEIQEFVGGNLVSSRTAKVTSIELEPDVTDGDFAIRFPAGTYVEDAVTKTFYIVLKNGGRRLVQDHEKAATYEEFLRSPTGQGLTTQKSTNWLPYFAVLGAIGAAALLFFRWKSRPT